MCGDVFVWGLNMRVWFVRIYHRRSDHGIGEGTSGNEAGTISERTNIMYYAHGGSYYKKSSENVL